MKEFNGRVEFSRPQYSKPQLMSIENLERRLKMNLCIDILSKMSEEELDVLFNITSMDTSSEEDLKKYHRIDTDNLWREKYSGLLSKHYGQSITLFEANITVGKHSWVSVKDRLPTLEDADEFGNILLLRKSNHSQEDTSKGLFKVDMVKHCSMDSMWCRLPKLPKNTQN